MQVGIEVGGHRSILRGLSLCRRWGRTRGLCRARHRASVAKCSILGGEGDNYRFHPLFRGFRVSEGRAIQLDNIRVSRKLWGAFIGLMIAMLIMSGWAQNRANNSMVSAMDAVVEIQGRIGSALRWRGATETAVTMIMGSAVTTDEALAQQYDARVKEIIGQINKVQETIVASATAPAEKAALDKV